MSGSAWREWKSHEARQKLTGRGRVRGSWQDNKTSTKSVPKHSVSAWIQLLSWCTGLGSRGHVLLKVTCCLVHLMYFSYMPECWICSICCGGGALNSGDLTADGHGSRQRWDVGHCCRWSYKWWPLSKIILYSVVTWTPVEVDLLLMKLIGKFHV